MPDDPDPEQVAEVRDVVLEAADAARGARREAARPLAAAVGVGRAQHVSSYSLDEVIAEAIEHVGVGADRERLRLSLDDDSRCSSATRVSSSARSRT